MHSVAFLSLLGVVAATAVLRSGETTAYLALKSVIERQTLCTPVTAPYTCERSCGPGYTECVSFPTCYNPGLGQSCCSNGRKFTICYHIQKSELTQLLGYCPKGTYCTNAGCCPDGTSLAQCGATITLSIIPPRSTTTSTSATTSKSTTVSISSVTSKSTSTSSSRSSTSVYYPTTSSSPSTTRAPTNGTTTSPTPTIVTAGVDKHAIVGVLPAVGGLVAMLLVF